MRNSYVVSILDEYIVHLHSKPGMHQSCYFLFIPFFFSSLAIQFRTSSDMYVLIGAFIDSQLCKLLVLEDILTENKSYFL